MKIIELEQQANKLVGDASQVFNLDDFNNLKNKAVSIKQQSEKLIDSDEKDKIQSIVSEAVIKSESQFKQSMEGEPMDILSEITTNDYDERLRWAVELLMDEMDGGTNEEKETFLNDVTSHGCESGIVTSVIMTADNENYFIDNMNDILEVLDDIDYKPDNMIDLPNYAVWACVELAASQLLEYLQENMD